MTDNPVASPDTTVSLELGGLLQLIAGHSASDLGRAHLERLAPTDDETELERRRRAYEESREMATGGALVPSCEEPFLPILSLIREGGHELGGPELLGVQRLLGITAAASRRVARAELRPQTLGAALETLPDVGGLRQRMRRTLDPRGEVRDDATPELKALRARIRRSRERLYRQLSDYVDGNADHLSESTIPRRGGRLVLLLKAGSRGRLKGLVHGSSGRGKSFYFEPFEAVDLNNDLQEAAEEEAAERRRILGQLVAEIRRELPALEAHAGVVGLLDALQAAARFAAASGSRLAETSATGELTLVGARHPLLDPALAELRERMLGTAGHRGAVVPLDLQLRPERRVLVLTGPNAGGKTVALKTVGLLALAHQCGLPIPAAEGSQLPTCRRVVATVGDDQDLLHDRSTFSGRLLRLREAWEAAGPESLVLLDELGSGTDPEEGAALAVALLESLLERRPLGLVTTHLSQLAAAALELEGAACAAMQFESETGRPTYRLLPGPPGASEAVALGRRLGLPPAWMDRAEELLGSEHRELRRMLAEVERTRRELDGLRDGLEAETRDAAQLRRRLAEREEELRQERRRVGQDLERRLEAFQRETREKLRHEVERLRAELDGGRRKGLAADATARLFAEAPQLAPADPSGGEIALGGRVRHRQLGWEGRLEKLAKGRAHVQVRGKTVRCNAGELIAATDDAAAAPRRAAVTVAAAEAEPPGELNLIGQRVESALESLDRFLDRSLLGSRPEVRIVHGHGSGRLRSAVREHLRRHPAVAALRPGRRAEGGDGATVARLEGTA